MNPLNYRGKAGDSHQCNTVNPLNYRGKAALVTGASSGIGDAFARALAARGMDLLLSGRSEEPLRALAGELATRQNVRAEVVRVNLAEPDAPGRLQAAADELRFEPDLLVNNAGLGVQGPFAETPLERQLETLRVNCQALAALSGLYLPRMRARRSGAILNIGSTAAFQPVPYLAVYAASTAFVVSFSEALWAEAGRYGVRVVVVCPGPVAETRFGERAGMPPSLYVAGRTVSREAVVTAALDALDCNRPTATVGFQNRLGALAVALVPRRLQLTVTERVFRRMGR